MEVGLIFKIAAVGILVSVIYQVLKHSGREEQAFLTSLAGLVLVLFWIIPYIKDLFQSIKDISHCKGCGMDIVKVAVIGIAGVMLSIIMKNSRSEYAQLVALVTAAVVFCYVTARIKIVIESVNGFMGHVGVESRYITILVKMTGIAYVSEFASSMCRDAGYQAVASQIEIFAKLSLLAVSLPVVTALINTIESSI